MKRILLRLLLLFSISIWSQNLDSLYTTYFENTRELPFLHLNKTSFLRGEEIWFQAYLIEQNSQKPHPTTSNLYISIFDDTGKLKEQRLVHIKNGIGKGNIYIDSTFIKDTYYIKASTLWMKNFNEDNSFSQEITLISSNNKGEVKKLIDKEYYEFKLLPEGGHLVANTNNNIGILIKDANNKGIEVTNGKIRNINGDIVSLFKTNKFGLGESNLFFKENQVYTFETTLANGQTLYIKTPKVEPLGITLNVVNSFYDKSFIINIHTNPESLIKLNNKTYRVFIHNTKSFRNFYFNFNNKDKTYALILKKADYPEGINIVTIFNENNVPLVERIFYNESEKLFSKLSIDKVNVIQDSLVLKLTNNTNEKVLLSASFLPSETRSYNPENNIKSSILLKPFVNGNVENSYYYFENTNKDTLKDLDLLLITQGWSKYSWNHIFNHPPSTNYPFENGIDITVKINNPIKSNQSILMYSRDNNIVRSIPFSMSIFTLENTFIKKNSIVDFALKDNDNLSKISPSLSYSNNFLPETFNVSHLPIFRNHILEISSFENLSKDIVALDEVIVKAKKKEYEKSPYGSVSMLRGVIMDDLIISPGETVINFLESKGFNITSNEGNLSIASKGTIFVAKKITSTQISSRGDELLPIESGNELSYSARMQHKTVRVYLDDNDITDNLWIIENMYLNTLERIFYGRDPGRYEQMIYIYTLSPSEYSRKKAEYSNLKIPVGFETEKEYYSPKYPSFIHDTYQNFGAIYWEPNITINPGSTFIKTPTNLQNEIVIYIEGISESGKLISSQKFINID